MWGKIVASVISFVKKTAAKNKNARDIIIAIIALPLMAFLLLILIIAFTGRAVSQFNNAAMSFLFGRGSLPSSMPSSVVAYYSAMGGMLDKLADAWGSITEEDEEDEDEDDEEGYSWRTDLSERELLMRISFYSLYYDRDEDSFTDEDYQRFASYFADGETVTEIYDELYEGEGVSMDSVGRDAVIDMWNHSYSYAIDWGEEGTSIDWGGWNDGRLTRTVFFEEGEIGPMVVQYAMTRLGDPYSPQMRGQGNYVDCSYLTMWAYAQVGITIPPVEGPQAQWIYDNGLEITYDQLQPGDLIFWSYKPWNSFRSITHTGIYAGDGMVIHASSGQKKVVLVPLFDKDKIRMYGRPY